jgi:hypothetical protein
MNRSCLRYLSISFVLCAVFLISISPSSAQTVARCGQGWLELIDGYPVLHLKGTPYEMGYQHGALMKKDVRENMNFLVHEKGGTKLIDFGPIKVTPKQLIGTILRIQEPHVPKKFFEELDGLADGSGLDKHDARVGNFIPEMFHCSGFAVMDSATKDGTLYHGRVLDYAIGWKLQEHAVIIVAEPKDGIPFVNVSYAGFIGSVTGMNANHVSIGEMGGRGLGHWEGIPMAFLVREALEQGNTLEEAISVFRDNPRTCEYYYVIADAKDNTAVGMEASWDKFRVIRPGEKHDLLPLPVKDCALLSAGGRYEELVRRVEAKHGNIGPEEALRLMDRGVAMKSNLHNVLFEPKSTRFWVANATADGKPAADQKYHQFQLSELLERQPSDDSKVIPFEKPKAVADK